MEAPTKEAPLSLKSLDKKINDKVDSITEAVGKLVDIVKELKDRPVASVAPTKQEQAVIEAKPDHAPISPLWEETARNIIGEAVDHCEIYYPKNGGTIFTVVIKKEHSNASADHWAMHKTDRRSREVSADGLQGVEAWCKLIKANLSKK